MLYAVSAFLVALIGGVWVYLSYFNAPPSCIDRKQNQGENGIDCGGPCLSICSTEAKEPAVLWARPFMVGTSSVTAAAYIQNTNPGAGARAVRYTFRLYDKNNDLVVERDGVMDLPPVTTVPIIETGITIGYRPPVRAQFSFHGTVEWTKILAGDMPSLSISNESLSSDGTRLSATITNNSFVDAPNVTVAAVLFDARDVALAASKTILSVDQKSSAPVVFTWPTPTIGVTHAEITVLPAI